MRVMGIDPGSNLTGYGIIEWKGDQLQPVHWGAIRTNSKNTFPRRLKNIYDELSEVISQYAPGAVAVEDLFFAANAKSALKLGQTRGVILLAAANQMVPIAEYTPLEVKQSVVGYGRADKKQVQYMVCRLLNLKTVPDPLDASDALAVAICHLHVAGTHERLRA